MKKTLQILTAAALAVWMISNPLSVLAQSSDQIREQMDALKQEKETMEQKISDLKGQIRQNNGEMEDLMDQKSNVEQQVTLLHGQIDNLNQQIDGCNTLIDEKQQELVEAQARLQALREKNKERIRAMEEQGSLSYWSVIFKAADFAELLDRLSMIQEIAQSDHRRLEQMHEAAQQVELAKTELESEKAALEQTRGELDEKKKELDSKTEEINVLLQKLTSMGAQYEQLLMDAEEKTNDLMDSLARKESQYQAAKDEEYQQWLEQQKPVEPPKPDPQTPTPPPASSGSWTVPIAYSYVSSPFGYRYHPIYHEWRLHAGIDLAAPMGTPIVASRSGVVTTASYEAGGAGNYVNINHMDGYVSRYMHMTHYIVSPGEKVTAGQVIGYCGATGAAEGPHLHFGIYENGVPIDPAPFIIG